MTVYLLSLWEIENLLIYLQDKEFEEERAEEPQEENEEPLKNTA